MNTKQRTPLPVIFFGKLWNWLTAPLEELPNIGDRRRSVTTTTFLLFAVVAVAIEQMAAANTPFIALILLIAGYFLARTRWFKFAALILVFTLIFPSYLVVLRLPDPDANRVLAAFAWVFVPLLLSSLIYSVRATVVISAINFGVLALLPFIRPELNYSSLGGALGFFGLVAVILVVVMTQRNEIEKDRQKELIASQESLRREVIERERFAEQAHRRADQLAMLNDVSVAISNLKELDNIFNLILEQVKQHFQLDVFFITIYNEKTGKLAFPLTFDDGELWNEPEKELSKAQRVAQVIRTGEPLLWNRSEDEIRAATNSENRVGDSARVAASILITPLQVGAKAIGAISIQSYTKNAYNNEQLMLLSALAHQIVIAIENARLFEETVKRTQRLAILNEIGREISTISDLPTLMENVYQQVRKALSVDLFFIGLYNAAKNELTFPIMYDAGRKWDQQPTRVLETTFSGKTILTRKPLLINHWTGATNENESTLTIVGDETRITQSLMFTPMLFGPETIGVLSVQSYDLNAFTEEDLNLLSGIANQVGIAIQNTRLLEETRQNAQSLLTMNEIGRAVSELTDLPTLLEKIYEQAQKTILLDVFYVGLYKLDSDEIIFPIMYDEGKRYEPTLSTINNNTVLSRLRQGAKAVLINRTPEEFGFTNSENRLGNTSKISASLMIAPLTVGNQVIGVISSQSYTLNAYSENDLNLLTGIANQVAVAIQNTRLLEETRQNAGYLATLNELGRVVSELRNLPELLEVIYQEVKKHLNVDSFYVGLYHPENNKVSYPFMIDEGIHYQQKPDTLTPYSFLSSLLNGEPATMLLRTEAELKSISSEVGMLGNESKKSASLLIAPLKVGEQVIGVISSQSYTLNAYTEEDLNLLVGIGNQVGVAVQNARLVEELKQNAEQLAILNEVGYAVSKIMDLPDLLEVVYEQGRKSISLDAFFVGLYHPDVDEVSFPIMYDSGVRFEQTRGFVSKNSFLRRFLNGEKSILMLRTEDELKEGLTNQKTLGKESKMSASLMAAPLISRDQVIGLISAQSYTSNAYNESDLRLLEGIASQVSIAIENSRLYTSAQQEISERQKIEEQLRDAESKYRELVERVPAVIYSSETGAAGRWFYVSPQIEALLGFTSEEWLADPHLWYHQIHPDDREYAVTTEAKLLAENSSLETEYRMYTKNGRLLWIHDESMNVSISDNQLYVVQGILTDVTIRKQAELTLKENEEKYHSLFITTERQARELTLLSEVQSALAQELDLSDLIHTVVEAIAKTFGYIFVSLYKLENGYLQLQHQVGYQSQNVIEKISPKEGISGKVVNTGHPILIKDVAQTPDFLRASPHIHSEICVPLFDGDEIFGTLNVESSQEYQLTEDDLRLMQALSEQVNIAIRRARLYADRAESLRRERHINEFAHAISSTLDLSNILEIVARLSVELIGADTGTVSLMSEDGAEMTNIYNFNEDQNLNAKLPKGQGLTWLVYEKGRPIVVDEYAMHPNAVPAWSASGLHAFMGVPIITSDKRLGAMALYNRNPEKKFTQRDVSLIEALAQEVAISIQNARLFVALQKELTDHKQTQMRLQVLVHELESKNAELERFTYSVSHDLKSPLVTIGGFLGFLEADIQKGEIQRIENTINRIREAAKKMQRLLDEILELSRIGRLINPPAEVPFGELVNEALELVHGQLTEKQVEVKVEAELPSVNVDRIRMVEVLQNLIANATKFTRHSEKPVIEIGTQIINEQQTFFVKDNGIGIAPEYHQKVFGLFDKLDAKSEGTGIGLALVKRIIEVHGGTIWVESETGKGATFFFTLEPKKQQENL